MWKKSDLEQLQKMIQTVIRDQKVATRDDLKGLKDDIIQMKDEIIGELKTSREEQTMITGRLSEHSDQLETHEVRLDAVEDILNKKPH